MVLTYSLQDVISLLKVSPQKVLEINVHISETTMNEIPIKHPFKINTYLLYVVISGHIKTQINVLDYDLKKGDVVIVPPNTVVYYKEASKDLQLITISFSLDFILNQFSTHQLTLAYFLINNQVKHLVVSEEQLNYIFNLSNLLKEKNSTQVNSYMLQHIVSNLFLLILLELVEIDKLSEKKHAFGRKESIFIKLLQLILENFRDYRSINFYANLLAVSKSYLNKITKELNQKTVNDLIQYALITEAKLLLSDKSFTISQIADSLNFSDQSSFTKFFKKHTSQTPIAYRKELAN